ncbi:hypothetical protein J3454_09305 [Erythrobacter sp. NFXS35]|uniref:hypothetical protein n=1 Tax=Erythrobacter sp. NFXS35 TaxID=2818436 RepID=UPI0032DEE272
MAESLKPWAGTDLQALHRAQDVGRVIYHAIRQCLGTPDILHPPLGDTKYRAQIQFLSADSAFACVDFNVETEAELNVGQGSGLLLELVKLAYDQICEHVILYDKASVRVRFNSWEYIHDKSDGFHRVRDGDWRQDFEYILNSDGELLVAPGACQ